MAPQLDVDEQLQIHAANIEALKTHFSDQLPPEFDDIWLLRFCLSNSDPETRADAVKKTIQYRAEKKDYIERVKCGEKHPAEAEIRQFICSGYHECSKDNEPLFIVRAGLSAPRSLMSAVPYETVLEWLMYEKEVVFRMCDKATRETRKITKMVAVIDMAHTGLLESTDSRFSKVQGESGKLSEVHYPQLLGRSVLINPPSFFSWVFSLFRHFMPAKALEKIGFCPGKVAGMSDQEGIKLCPFARERLDLSKVPTFLGGTCTCTAKGGCIQATPNDCTAPKSLAGSDGMIDVFVGARDSHSVVLTARHAGDRLAWKVKVESKGIEISAILKPDGGGEPVTLVAVHKIKAEEGSVEGFATVPSAGTVTVLLDNRYSMMTAKNVKYTAAVLPVVAAPLDKPEMKEAQEQLDQQITEKLKAMDVAASTSSVAAAPQ